MYFLKLEIWWWGEGGHFAVALRKQSSDTLRVRCFAKTHQYRANKEAMIEIHWLMLEGCAVAFALSM